MSREARHLNNIIMKSKTRKAYFRNKNGSKQWFEIPTETAEKVLKLQKMFREDAKKKKHKNN